MLVVFAWKAPPIVVVARWVYSRTLKFPVVEAEAKVALPVVVSVATRRFPTLVALLKVRPARPLLPELTLRSPLTMETLPAETLRPFSNVAPEVTCRVLEYTSPVAVMLPTT